jgi:hypothetical protein
MTLVWHEFHDLPDTPTRKACWVEVKEYQLVTGKLWRTLGNYWSSSRETGADLPQERA